MAGITNIQLGKQGLTSNFIETLRNHFLKNQILKISVLKSAGHERGKVKSYAENILKELGVRYTSRVIGFTIVIKKWRRDMRWKIEIVKK